MLRKIAYCAYCDMANFDGFLNNCLFFLVDSGDIILWDYKNNQQFIIDDEQFQIIKDLSESIEVSSSAVLKELIENKILEENPQRCDVWQWDKLSHLFHIGTKDVLDQSSCLDETTTEMATSYLEACQQLQQTELPKNRQYDGRKISLPTPDMGLFKSISFFDVINKRATCRDFVKKPVSLNTLSNILFSSFGNFHGDQSTTEISMLAQRKTSPSSGGVHAEEAYIVIYNISGLKPGLYHYQPGTHDLCPIKMGNHEDQIIQMNYSQYYSKNIAFGVYVTSRFDQHWWKYKHSRQYRVALLDLGHVSQAFLLAATACDLSTWITAAFQDTPVENFLNIDGVAESVILFLGAGFGNNSPIPKAIKDVLNDNKLN